MSRAAGNRITVMRHAEMTITATENDLREGRISIALPVRCSVHIECCVPLEELKAALDAAVQDEEGRS